MHEVVSKAFRADGALRFCTLGVLGVSALYLVPPLVGEELLSWYEGSLLTQVLVLFALQHRLREITRAAERRFWALFSWSFFSWIVAAVFGVFFPQANLTAPGGLFEDVCYLLFYLLFLFAIESHPHRVIPEDAAAWRRRRFEIEGAILFAFGLLVYLVLIPMLTDMDEYSTALPSGCLYVTIDAVILARTFYAYRLARSTRWRTTYRLIMLTVIGMLATDIFDALILVPGFIFDADTVPPAIYTFWYLFPLPLILAARLRHFLPSDKLSAASEAGLVRKRIDFPFSNILLLYAFLLPVVHLVLQALEFFGTVRWRSLSVLFYLVAFAQLIRRQQKYEVARSRFLERERAQLQQQREEFITELESKNTELEQFTYTVSHDLKSPLVTIRGFLGLLREDLSVGKAERVESDLIRIDTAAEKMGRLLEELLELSRIGRFIDAPQEVSLSEVAYEAVELIEGPIRECGAKVEIASDLPTVYGDRRRFLQMFQNLLENAVKFMGPQTEPRIAVSVRADGGEPVCCVEDNGVGIAPRYFDKIFDLFQRLDPTIEGTGVGLALVRRIIELHGGRIWVESEGQGRGCTVCFTLPGLPAGAEGRAESAPGQVGQTG